MKKTGLFFVNFGLSLIVYTAIILLGFLLHMVMYFFPSTVAREISLWVVTLITVTLFFLLGTGLNLLGKHWLNYLSVCGTFVIALFVAFQSLTFVAAFLPLPFPIFLPFLRGWHNFSDIVILVIVTLFPSIFIWLGMVRKSRKLKKKQSKTVN